MVRQHYIDFAVRWLEWIERPPSVLVGGGIRTTGFEPWLSQINDLNNWYLLLPILSINIIRTGYGAGEWRRPITCNWNFPCWMNKSNQTATSLVPDMTVLFITSDDARIKTLIAHYVGLRLAVAHSCAYSPPHIFFSYFLFFKVVHLLCVLLNGGSPSYNIVTSGRWLRIDCRRVCAVKAKITGDQRGMEMTYGNCTKYQSYFYWINKM